MDLPMSSSLVDMLHQRECFGRLQLYGIYLTLIPSGYCLYHMLHHQNCIFPTQWVYGFCVIHRRIPY